MVFDRAEGNFNGVFDERRHLPLALIVKDDQQGENILFDLSQLLAAHWGTEAILSRAKATIREAGWPAAGDWRAQTLTLMGTSPLVLPEDLRGLKSDGSHISFGMLTLQPFVEEQDGFPVVSDFDESSTIFSPNNKQSLDFQMALVAKGHIFEGKTVNVLGPGIGVDALYALFFGAKKVTFFDTNPAHNLLTAWNIQYAKDTGQIPSDREAVLVHGISDADIYLFNTPGVGTAQDIARQLTDLQDSGRSPPSSQAIRSWWMNDQEFRRLFDNLKTQLRKSPKAVAIWRFLISESTGLVDPRLNENREDQIDGFLNQEGLTGEFINPTAETYDWEHHPGIYLIQDRAGPGLASSSPAAGSLPGQADDLPHQFDPPQPALVKQRPGNDRRLPFLLSEVKESGLPWESSDVYQAYRDKLGEDAYFSSDFAPWPLDLVEGIGRQDQQLKEFLDGISRDDRVVLLGSGLTFFAHANQLYHLAKFGEIIGVDWLPENMTDAMEYFEDLRDMPEEELMMEMRGPWDEDLLRLFRDFRSEQVDIGLYQADIAHMDQLADNSVKLVFGANIVHVNSQLAERENAKTELLGQFKEAVRVLEVGGQAIFANDGIGSYGDDLNEIIDNLDIRDHDLRDLGVEYSQFDVVDGYGVLILKKTRAAVDPGVSSPAIWAREDINLYQKFQLVFENIEPTEVTPPGDIYWENIAVYDGRFGKKIVTVFKASFNQSFYLQLDNQNTIIIAPDGTISILDDKWHDVSWLLTAIREGLEQPEAASAEAAEVLRKNERLPREPVEEMTPELISKRQSMFADLQAKNNIIKGIPKDQMSLRLFLKIMTILYRNYFHDWAGEIGFQEEVLGRYDAESIKGLFSEQDEQGNSWLDVASYQGLRGNHVEFASGIVLLLEDDEQSDGVRVMIKKRDLDLLSSMSNEDWYKLYRDLIENDIPVAFNQDFLEYFLPAGSREDQDPNPVSSPGGIDLNPQNMAIQESGGDAKIYFPPYQGPVPAGIGGGLVPVILHISPPGSLSPNG